MNFWQKNWKKILIWGIIAIIVILAGILITKKLLGDENKLSVFERNWINNNQNNVQNINVVNDINIFGDVGSGVFYDFLNDFSEEYDLKINPITYKNGETVSGLTLGIKNTLNNNDTLFYKDHYVLISKENKIIRNYSDLTNKNIGVKNSDLSHISNYLSSANINFKQYSSIDELMTALDKNEIEYVAIPLLENLSNILGNNLNVIYHFSDIPTYYVIKGIENDTLSSVLRKYYNNWHKKNLKKYFKEQEFKTILTSLSMTGTEVDAMQSITYNYGFVNNSPYEVIKGSNYGGIVATYLNEFSEFSGIDFKFTKYSNYNKFINALNQNKIDLYFDYYNTNTQFNTVNTNMAINYVVFANLGVNEVITSTDSLKGKTLYVHQNSALHEYFKTINGVNLQTFANNKELFKIAKKNNLIALDANIYNYYVNTKLKNVAIRYNGVINNSYNFKVKSNNAIYKLFSAYTKTLDAKEMTYKGLDNHAETLKTGNILTNIAKWALFIIVIVGGIVFFIYKKSKRIKVAKKIKKEDKIKFIDQLTSMKNRNYLNENINEWNNNLVVPQTIIIIDLNNIQEINDTKGYEEGDKQIKAAANALIKTQLDNSDIMRSDGNEFIIYLVGYNQKQITSYIHKLNKEFNNLPYEYGAAIGYSMKTDNIKTIEDTINDATISMKKQKVSKENANEKKN